MTVVNLSVNGISADVKGKSEGVEAEKDLQRVMLESIEKEVDLYLLKDEVLSSSNKELLADVAVSVSMFEETREESQKRLNQARRALFKSLIDQAQYNGSKGLPPDESIRAILDSVHIFKETVEKVVKKMEEESDGVLDHIMKELCAVVSEGESGESGKSLEVGEGVGQVEDPSDKKGPPPLSNKELLSLAALFSSLFEGDLSEAERAARDLLIHLREVLSQMQEDFDKTMKEVDKKTEKEAKRDEFLWLWRAHGKQGMVSVLQEVAGYSPEAHLKEFDARNRKTALEEFVSRWQNKKGV